MHVFLGDRVVWMNMCVSQQMYFSICRYHLFLFHISFSYVSAGALQLLLCG